MPGNIHSKAQAGLFGAVAADKKKLPGLSSSEAKESLRGVKTSKLPMHSGMMKKKMPKM
jgi:hypothetical protein